MNLSKLHDGYLATGVCHLDRSFDEIAPLSSGITCCSHERTANPLSVDTESKADVGAVELVGRLDTDLDQKHLASCRLDVLGDSVRLLVSGSNRILMSDDVILCVVLLESLSIDPYGHLNAWQTVQDRHCVESSRKTLELKYRESSCQQSNLFCKGD